MKNVCIIPAKGGTKRIPCKNVTPFLRQVKVANTYNCATVVYN